MAAKPAVSLSLAAELAAGSGPPWTAVLRPRRDDAGYEVAAAERMMLLLVRVCAEAAGIRSPPSYLESHLAASGWSPGRVELAIHGARISSLLAQVAPGLREIVSQSSP